MRRTVAAVPPARPPHFRAGAGFRAGASGGGFRRPPPGGPYGMVRTGRGPTGSSPYGTAADARPGALTVAGLPAAVRIEPRRQVLTPEDRGGGLVAAQGGHREQQ
ncbi:hypothetical protein Srufu_055280 [Streptomyces libani subsp. rufus]|nr:hypothetical protein Srufu_055280 [Streptomyces libani subsp. rufus]